MAYESVKKSAKALGLYRAARYCHRHVLNRRELHLFRREMAFYAEFAKPGSLCFDVGANVGEKTEIFLALGARVVAFEPQHDCLEELKARLPAAAPVVPVSSAVGHQPGTLPLHVARGRVSSTFNRDWLGDMVGSIEVPVTTLDEAIRQFGVPQYCKIDVEGYELEVLSGLSQAIPIVTYEYHVRDNGGERALACLERLSRFGELLVCISPSDKPARAGSKWMSKGEFVKLFRSAVPYLRGYHYGDIFVKTATQSWSRP